MYIQSHFCITYLQDRKDCSSKIYICICLVFPYGWVYNGDSDISQFFFSKPCWYLKNPRNVCRHGLQLKSDLHLYLVALFGLLRIYSPFCCLAQQTESYSGAVLLYSSPLTSSGELGNFVLFVGVTEMSSVQFCRFK